ncbi:hypothetical protein P175DRAFT_0510612 [Aspergillus ochraceoroseus IBT 24754]|uniref:Rieske domain-containing protein n=2 Tax=Aspergillus ochraceoroseus TaxID=138278 RepID=A0A2T5LST8_9EURO|nr:uncharacterized protein P175DRAFT_0510612 [Aspergillus ochraceoroseus IBT 24754]KKK22351.1 hypothetical protein AOCH_002882 [Aspergillus ochraceoroseus]PTU19345.1 hypothetical protein P175DRAFT_0510612 [Aspergillus ochraceoroseus IBT 24754]
MIPFVQSSHAGAGWHLVGRASAFPDVSSGNDDCQVTPSCKAFSIPKTNSPGDPKAPVEADLERAGDLKDQVLVFKYKGKFHAIDHQCPHSSFPLSQGSLFDIEDFGVVLSAGITCPKHGWSFDIFSGLSDRGSYKLKVWDVQLRNSETPTDEASETTDQEVWVRRKQRIG